MDSNIHNGSAEVIEELDRSLSSTQVSLPFIRQQLDSAEKMLSEEEMPEISETSVESIADKSLKMIKNEKTSDYSRVQSKVKKYIDQVKEQQHHRRRLQQQQQQQFTPLDNIHQLQRQLEEKDVQVAVLQDEYQAILLQNAQLKNLVDQMRSRAAPLNHTAVDRRTNSPPAPILNCGQLKQPAPVVDGSFANDSGESLTFSSPSTYRNAAFVPLSGAIDPTNQSLERNSASYSSSPSSSSSSGYCWNSLAKRDEHTQVTIQKKRRARNVQSRSPNDDSEKQRGYLMDRMQETMLMASVVKKQSRALIQRTKLVPR